MLAFNSSLYPAEQARDLIESFQSNGYVVLPEVYDRVTVDGYYSAVLEEHGDANQSNRIPMDDTELCIRPIQAPRVRQLLAAALWCGESTGNPTPERYPALFELSFYLAGQAKELEPLDGWHKDRDLNGMPGPEYHYPREVHIGTYFTDMTPAHGPTEVIPGSHRNLNLSPYSGDPVESFLCRKEDVVLWDQRLWHRATHRVIEGTRVFGVFGFYSAPAPRRMRTVQKNAWLNAQSREDQVFYGGVFHHNNGK